MVLKSEDFRKSTVIKSGIECIQYIYESAKFVYIVEINTKTNKREYKTNFGFALEPTKFHRAIEKHYFLGGV